MADSGGKFLKILCPRCKQKYVTFGKSSISLKCKKCGYLLTRSRGGKTQIRAIVQEVIWN